MSCKSKVRTFQEFLHPEPKAEGRKHSACDMGLETCNHRREVCNCPKTLLTNP